MKINQEKCSFFIDLKEFLVSSERKNKKTNKM